MFLVEPGTAAGAGGEELVLERGVDDAYDWTVLDDEADGDAEHGEEVGVVDSSWGMFRWSTERWSWVKIVPSRGSMHHVGCSSIR